MRTPESAQDQVKKQCPHCISPYAVPLPYRWSQVLMALILVRPYRCCHCKRRFLASVWRRD